jgi:hypothetical protein
VIPQVFLLLLLFLFSVIFGTWDFRGKDLEVFLCGICFGNHT